MELLSKNSTDLILIENNIPIKKFHQKSQCLYFCGIELTYSSYRLKFKFTICADIFKKKAFFIEKEPFIIKRTDELFSVILKVKKNDFINSSKKDMKIVKYQIDKGDFNAKVLIYVPSVEKKRTISREEWIVQNPLQGGAWSPR